jgi:putative transposase
MPKRGVVFEDHKESGELGRLALRGAKPGDVAAPDLIGHDFTATAADLRWCGDSTYVKTWDRWAYMYVLWNPSCTNLHVRNGLYLRGYPPNEHSVECDGGAFHRMATVSDLHSRKVVGWAVADHMRTDAVGEHASNVSYAIM